MHAGADVDVRQPRRVAVRLVGGDVVDGERPLVGRERAAARRRVVRDALAVPGRVVVEGSDRVDRGELVERDLAVVHRVEPVRDAAEERGERAARSSAGTSVPGAVGTRATSASSSDATRRLELGHPEPVRQQRVHQLEPARDVQPAVILRSHLRHPASHDVVDRHADAEHASRVQAFEQCQVALAQRRRRQRLLLAHEAIEIDLAQPLLELVEGAVLRQHEPAVVDECAVRPPALLEITRVLLEDVVGQHDGGAELIPTTDVQMQAPRVERPRRESRVEGRLALDRSRSRTTGDRPAPRRAAASAGIRPHSTTIAIHESPPHRDPSPLSSSSSFPRSSV